MGATSRTLVRQGIASYFGGNYVPNIRAYQGGPLASAGLSTVRAGWGKRLNFADFVQGQMAGRGMGAYGIVEIGDDLEVRRAKGGPPVVAGGTIVSGGTVFVWYMTTLNVFHMAQKGYAEDAQADIDLLIEAIKMQIRVDRTLGGICTQAGQDRFGIQTKEGYPGVDPNGRTGTWFRLQFKVLTQFVS